MLWMAPFTKPSPAVQAACENWLTSNVGVASENDADGVRHTTTAAMIRPTTRWRLMHNASIETLQPLMVSRSRKKCQLDNGMSGSLALSSGSWAAVWCDSLAKTSNAVDTEPGGPETGHRINNHARADVDHRRNHSGLARAAACRCARTEDANRAVSTYGLARGGRRTRVRTECHRTNG